MCLTTKDATIKKATRNIFCYKVGRFCHYSDHTVFSTLYGQYEELQLKPVVKLEPFGTSTVFLVHEGYHSYNSIVDAVKEMASFNKLRGSYNKKVVGLFMIPKGAEYIDGWYNEEPEILNRVSSQIIYLGKVGKFSTTLRRIKHTIFQL